MRVCDGYYYTLSTTPSRERFAQDAEKCAGQYPSGRALLFYHPFPHGDVDQALSLSGERYGDQNYAFAFRREFMPHCAAELHQGLAALEARVYAAVPMLREETEATGRSAETRSPIPIPIPRRDQSTDPETFANRIGDFVAPPQVETAETIAMRTVGDPFFVDSTSGPPPTVPGYEPPMLEEFRLPKSVSLTMN